MKIECGNPEPVLKEAFWLAWLASSCVGMGFLQNRPEATKDDVWASVFRSGTRYSTDYVFGRMMKLRIEANETSITVPDDPPRFDYQSWCGRYKTYEQLIREAMVVVG